MKKIIILILLFVTYSVSIKAQAPTVCCPEFALKFKKDVDCLKEGSCATANGESNFTASMCKYSTNTFIVVPNLSPGYTYAWTITGGVFSPSGLTTSTANPATITWGGGGSATITVVITSADGKCKKTIKEIICLRDAPKANFSFTPNNACAGTLINFTNTSIGGAAVSWDFGDGTFAGNVNNPTHVYAPVMVTTTYNVTITVYSDTADCRPGTQSPVGTPGRACCGCISTYTLPVTVIAGNPLTIIPKECVNQCLCVGDTAEYCATKICAPYNWTVTGGTIISGAGTSCIKVKWTGPYPTSIQLVQPGCGSPCNDTSRLNVPVLVSGIPIMPNVSPVCQFTTQTYYLPAMPGVFYNWNVTGGVIVGPNQNTSTITVMWGPGPTGQVNCTYNNPLKPGCDGTTNLPVSIKPVLKINGPTQTCQGCSFTLFTGGATPVTWTATGGAICTPPVGTATSISFPVTGVMSSYTITAASAAFCNSPQTTTVVVAPKPVLTIAPLTVQTCPGTPVKFVVTSTVTTTPITWVLPAGASMVANTGPQLDTAVIQFTTIPATVTAEQNCAFNLSCSKGTVSATVTKPPVPIISPTVSNPCIDETVNYVVTNAVPGVVYTWAISSTLGTITSGQGTSSVNILWHGGTPNTATLTASNCAGTSLPVNVTVTLPNFPSISVGGTCIKTGMTLTSTTSGPWLWTGPGIVSGQGTNTININQPGTYCVTINAGSPGSCAQQKCITIPPNPYWVKIIPPCSVSSCNINSLSVLLTVQTNIGAPTGCQWMFDPAGGPVVYSVVSTSCGNYTATALGSYYLIMTDANGCKDTSNIIRIPQDINICCATAACNALSTVSFNFTSSGCQPTAFTGSPLLLPPGWTTGTLHPTICYGDGTSDDFISLNTTHQYAAANSYTVCVVQKVVKTSTNDTCCISTCKQVIVPVVTNISASYNCITGKLTVLDNSTFYPGPAGAVISWTYSGPYTGSFVNVANQTQIITPTASGSYTVTLTVTLAGCTSVATYPVTVVMPNCTINAIPNPGCDGAPVNFSTTAGLILHNWQFGDGKFSYAAATQHIYPGPGTYNVVLTASTPDGCPVTCSLKVVIQAKPIVTITPKNVTVCPNSPVTLTANMNLNGNTMCSSYNLQWYNNGAAYGAPVPVASFPVNLTVNSYGNFYAVLTGSNPGCNCVVTTDTILIKWYAKPIAKIKGKSSVCLTGGTGTLNVENAVSSYPTYNWSSSNPGSISFSPANVYNPVVTITAAGGPFQIFLEVIDANGCKAYDTLCIYTNNSPTAFITPPGATLCAGNTYTITATPSPLTAPPAGYAYLWNNTATTNTINATAAGVYYAFVTDMNTGCATVTNSVVINKGPDVSLFPSCCDTICDNAPINISVPLPLAPGENICTKYGIVWLDNGVPLSPQPSPCNILNTATLVPLLGMHNLSIVVTLNGCKDTSNVFSLYIKHCGDCDCKGSSWGETQIVEGDHPKEKDGVKNGASTTQVSTKTSTGQVVKPITIKCNSNQKLDCKKTYTVSSSYNCKDTACGGKVTFSLQPPTGPAITGTGTITFTTNVTGTYVLTMYGWCGDKICDSCVIKFEVNCVDCNCKGSKWGEQTVTINNNTKTFKCGNNYDVKCKTPVTVNANYLCADPKCNGAVTYTLLEPNGGTTTGTLPLTFTPTQTGTYTLTMYGYCGTTLCDSCVIKFTTDCPPPPCCPYEIKADAGTVKYDYSQIPNATVGSQTFTINGLAAANITEVRANVVSYNITDNFGKECMKCVNLPFTWASIASANAISGVPGLITMFGGAGVPSFNGSGAGAYQNPREVIWNNGTQINIPANTNIGMNFILPPVPAIDCCELKGKICVKFTFRDNQCKECEVIVCFEFMIKKK